MSLANHKISSKLSGKVSSTKQKIFQFYSKNIMHFYLYSLLFFLKFHALNLIQFLNIYLCAVSAIKFFIFLLSTRTQRNSSCVCTVQRQKTIEMDYCSIIVQKNIKYNTKENLFSPHSHDSLKKILNKSEYNSMLRAHIIFCASIKFIHYYLFFFLLKI